MVATPAVVDSAAMPREPSDSTQITCRVPNDWLPFFDEIATALSRPGLEITKTEAIRVCIARGLEELKAELKLGKTKR